MKALHTLSVFLFLWNVIISHTYQGAVSMVMSVRRRQRTSPREAVAMVTGGRNETRLRLLLHGPRALFSLLGHPASASSQNRVLARGNVTSQIWVAVDADYDDNVYYVIDRKAQAIKVVDQESSQVFSILPGISSKAQALAVNWLDDSIYWSDAAYDAIFMYKAVGRCRLFECVSTVVGINLDTPTGVAVHPHLRLVFWTDVSGSVGKLERSDLNGGNRTLLFEQLSQPSAVTIDYSAGRVYWLAQSGEVSVVESCSLSGGDRYSAAVLPASSLRDLAFLDGLLMMTDFGQGELVMHDVNANVTRRLGSAGAPYGVCIFSASKQRSDHHSQQTMMPEERDVLHEGFLVLVTEQGSIHLLEKTAITAAREVTAREIISRDSVTAIAADVRNKLLYFYHRRHRAIQKISLQYLSSNTSGTPSAQIVTRIPGHVAGLAVDWLSGTVYWTDNHYRRVAAITAHSRHVRCLACRHVDQPRDVVVHPMKSLVFWTDVETGNPRIERVNVITLRRDVILSRQVRSLALAVDFKHDMLYWSEGPLLCRADLEGRGSDPCSSAPSYTPLAVKSLDLVHDFIVWTDFGEGVRVSDKEDNFDTLFTDSRVLLPGEFVSDLLYFHPSRQPSDNNPCADNNGGCEHFCVPMPGGNSRCTCATGYWSARNGSCLSGFVNSDFVLVTDPTLGGIYQQFLYLPTYYVIPVRHVQRPADVAYDVTTGKVYWCDLGLGVVSRAFLDGSRQEIVFAHSVIVPEKLYLDERQQLLYFIDTTRQKVGVISLDTDTFTVLVQSFQMAFHDVAVVTSTGLVYLSASSSQERQAYVSNDVMFNNEGSILRYDVNSSDLSEVVTTVGEPHGMAISGEVMYWINAGRGTLNTLNLTSGDTSLRVSFPDWIKPDDVTLLGDYVYWTDFERPRMYRLRVGGEQLVGEEEEVEEWGDTVLFQLSAITTSEPQEDGSAGQGSRDPCRHDAAVTSRECLSVVDAIESVLQEKGICRVPQVQNGQVLTLRSRAYVIFDEVISVECYPGYGERRTGRRTFTSRCDNGAWAPEPQCLWAMSYNVVTSRRLGFLRGADDLHQLRGASRRDVPGRGGHRRRRRGHARVQRELRRLGEGRERGHQSLRQAPEGGWRCRGGHCTPVSFGGLGVVGRVLFRSTTGPGAFTTRIILKKVGAEHFQASSRQPPPGFKTRETPHPTTAMKLQLEQLSNPKETVKALKKLKNGKGQGF
ncbi:prolow-density lipoprotein receptor-related protein 1-like [Babylonia areolata]|uniref:prolow-density lipoprotein receptor-related protein 1-like n=1 Tax=Babylonia areolata TaxID=304850 RepID=UPI003FD6311B